MKTFQIPQNPEFKIKEMSKHAPKRVQKNAPGASRPQGGSKLPSESNGMPPGAQKPDTKVKNPEDISKFRKSPHPHNLLSNFSWPYR